MEIFVCLSMAFHLLDNGKFTVFVFFKLFLKESLINFAIVSVIIHFAYSIVNLVLFFSKPILLLLIKLPFRLINLFEVLSNFVDDFLRKLISSK